MNTARSSKCTRGAKPRSGDAIPAEVIGKPSQAVAFDVLRREINAEVTGNAVEMVRAMIQHAKDGQHQAMKFLFALVGLYPATAEEESSGDDSLAGILLNRLGISQEQDQKSEDGQNPMAMPTDAVE